MSAPANASAVKPMTTVRNAKFEFTGETKDYFGITLHRIRAVAAIVALGVAVGDLGGWVEKEDNLSVSGDAWVYGNAQVSGDASVSGNAWVSGDAWVYGDAWGYGDARVSGDALVYGNAWVYGVNITATRTDGYTFLVAPTPDGPRIIAGCRYFTFDEAEAHWSKTRGGTKLGDETSSIIAHLKRMAELNGFMEPCAPDEVAA